MAFQFPDGEGYGTVLKFLGDVSFEFEHQHREILLTARIGQKLVQSGNGFAVFQPVAGDPGPVGVVDSLAIERLVVKDDHFTVGGHADVELRSPESRFVGGLERRQRVACAASGFAVPVTAVRHDSYRFTFRGGIIG